MANRIHLKGDHRLEENIAAGTITPGHLIERTSAGLVQVHSVAGDPAEAYFALEDVTQGKTTIDDYSINDRVFGILPVKGGEISAILKGGVTAADGIPLSSSGDGTLELVGAGDFVVAFAQEALDLNALPAAPIKVRVI